MTANANANNINDAANPRSSSPTQVACSMTHPTGCTCATGLLSHLPKAMYRKFRDDDDTTFMGMFVMDANNKTMFRPNNPNMMIEPGMTVDSLVGKGHVVDDDEFCFTSKLYFSDPEDRAFKNGDNITKMKEITNILHDFSDKPEDFDIRMVNDGVDGVVVAFPHGIPPSVHRQGCWTIPQIRVGDKVRIMASKYVDAAGMNATERCWVQILGVACTPGYVVGIMQHDIDSPLLSVKQFPSDMTLDEDYQIHEDDLVSFPVTCVYSVVHGKNWAD
eukprot:CAMPEP_0194046844 /NCGR_PEP_ID=MMETSP0009_2-20130614/22613_1 /TAXON_ID=210454 /ORGANISM="Grammatophora oceanica, Strain CCMP 410" /LENGTH=274 /DNA_ID=CAMNT_0038692287 /DNA_START=68 /DNA_END=892 /DNA_ORIENTATION=+